MSLLYDLEYLKNLGFRDPSKFKYNGKSWSAWYSKKFNKYLIKNHTDNTKPTTVSNWIKTVYLGETPKPIYSTIETSISSSLNYEDYKLCLVNEELSDEFLNYLEIETFYEIYQTHPNISTFDFSFCNSKFNLNKMYGKRNILFFDTGEEFYGKFKFNSESGWLNIKGTKNLGACFKNKKSSRTLILCEGLKDGINANIAFPSADILVTDSKTIPFKFEKHQVEPKQYQKIILAVDRDVTANEQLDLLFHLNANFYKKVFPIDWKQIPNEITDLTEWIKSLNFSLSKYKKNGLSTLKKFISTQNFYSFYIERRVEELDRIFQNGKENSNLNRVRRVIKIKNLLGANLSKEAKFLIENGIKSKNEEIINLNANGKLSDFSKQIIDIVETYQKTLLNAPTGTGKSYLVKNIFPVKYKNIIAISPLRMVTDEITQNSIFRDVKRIEDISSPYIAMTTDIFQNLFTKQLKLLKERMEKAEVIIFDEQHLYKESKNFRDKVIRAYEYLLYRFNGKVLFMSGTPVIPKDVELKIITAKVPNSSKKIIEYSKDGFENIDEMVAHIAEEVKSASVMVYCSSKQKVEEVTKLLIKSKISVFSMTSIEIRENGLLVKNKKIKFGNYAYISTTKATTGITIPNLKGIYQYGTAYNANTFIQLLGRLRNGGFVHYIQPKFEHQQEKFLKNHTIGVVKGFQKLNVTKLSNSFHTPEFQDWIRNNFYIPFHQKDLEGFLDHFKEALQVIEAKGLGHFNIERNDYIFNGIGIINIEELFDNSDAVNFEKYIDRIIIDWINQNDVELLNKIYNLSFIIKEVKYQKNIQKMELISLDDKEQKKEKRKKLNSETKEFYNQLEKKFQGCLPLKTLKKSFSLGELTRLNEMDIDLQEIKNFYNNSDRVIRLKAKLIPINEIIKIAKEIIDKKGYCTLKELDIELQKVYIINSRNKTVYLKFLIDISKNKLLNDRTIRYIERKKIGGTDYRNLLVNYN